MKITYEVEITDINIDDFYYDFQYKVWKNGELIGEDEYQNDHVWRDDKEAFKKMLEEGYASQLALEAIF